MLSIEFLTRKITCMQAVGSADDEAQKYGYESWIDYCHKVNLFTRFVSNCPCCNNPFTNDNPAVGGHVLADYRQTRLIDKYTYTKCITPICKSCNDHFKNNQAWKVFNVRAWYLCRLPNKPPKR